MYAEQAKNKLNTPISVHGMYTDGPRPASPPTPQISRWSIRLKNIIGTEKPSRTSKSPKEGRLPMKTLLLVAGMLISGISPSSQLPCAGRNCGVGTVELACGGKACRVDLMASGGKNCRVATIELAVLQDVYHRWLVVGRNCRQ